ncbi:SDR family oxidoreductase [Alkalibaculum sp. M08DMB]|uniref:SDR family oxidoreductase n=1 Tax=Alkalibaculum sporogenes TaxID=2655001 RepID=A0A6A7K7A3_9FIRM|nr:SDR family oxidoreductase [Alkalibaculum sporogenes]MPW25242.1 SDR family oxidoreductase [Alkalibaculum sporogenes]
MKDYFGYKDKICVVTGATSGMGKATAEMLSKLGAKVYAIGRNNKVEIEGIEKFIQADLNIKDSIDKAFTHIPDSIDSFFGIAGVSGMKNDFNSTVTIDFIANKYICENYLTKRMKEGSSIAFITSTGGIGWEKDGNKKEYMPLIKAKAWKESVTALEGMELNALPGPLGYAFAKLAMNYYVAYLQEIFASKHIRVNAVLPGATDTGIKNEFSKAVGGDENLLKFTGFAGRLAESSEMAEPVVFLNSNMARYVSGELLIVDYGTSICTQAGIQNDPMGGATFDKIKLKFVRK